MTIHQRLDEIWNKALQENPCICGHDDEWSQDIKGSIYCDGCETQVVAV